MKPTQEPSKRIVSKGAFAWAVAKSFEILVAGMTAFAGAFTGVLFLIVKMLEYGKTQRLGLLVACLCVLVIIGLFYNSDAWFHYLDKKSKSVDLGVPLTRANTADLPAPDSLVRASQEPRAGTRGRPAESDDRRDTGRAGGSGAVVESNGRRAARVMLQQKQRKRMSIPMVFIITWIGSTGIGCLVHLLFLGWSHLHMTLYYLIISLFLTVFAAYIESWKARR